MPSHREHTTSKGAVTKSSEPARQRFRASLACQSCRQRKVKCNVQDLEPGSICGPCEAVNTACIVNRDSDKRKFGSRKHVATLQSRILSLEAIIRQSQSNISASNAALAQLPENRQSFPQTVVTASSKDAPATEVEQSVLPEESHDHSVTAAVRVRGLSPLNFYDRVPQQPVPRSIEACQTQFDSFSQRNLPPQQSNGPSESLQTLNGTDNHHFIEHTAQDGNIQQLRRQRLSSAGPAESDDSGSYYGPTCELHVSSPFNTVHPSTQPVPRVIGVNLNIDSAQLKSKLLKSYWNFQKLSVTIMHKKVFMTHMSRGLRSTYYSAFLESALLACSARLSTSGAIRKASEEYARRAKSELMNELEHPNVATLQGLLLLSDFEMTRGHDRVGWIYCGIACRLIFDLGLHDDPHDDSTHDNLVSPDTSFHRILAMGCLVYERLWSLYLGRPSCLSSEMFSPLPKLFSSDNATLHAWLGLCVPLGKICSILNSPSTPDPHAIDNLSDLESELRNWYAVLPSQLALDACHISDLDPGVYGLHMQYCRLQMLLHGIPNASLRKCKLGSGISASNSLRGWTAGESEKVIHHNAVIIAQLGGTYKQIYGAENMATVMLDSLYAAATTLIFYFLKRPSASSDNEHDLNCLESLDEVLEELQKHFLVAARMRHTLAQLIKGTSLANLFSSHPESNLVLPLDALGTDISGGSWGSIEAAMSDFAFGGELVQFNSIVI